MGGGRTTSSHHNDRSSSIHPWGLFAFVLQATVERQTYNAHTMEAIWDCVLKSKDADKLPLLLEKYIDSGKEPSVFSSRDDNGRTLLWCASDAGDEEMVSCLLVYGATASLELMDVDEGITPLMAAAKKNHSSVLSLLLKNGACSDSKSSSTIYAGCPFLLFHALFFPRQI